MLSRDYPDPWIYPVSGARSPEDHHELMCILDELERALGSPFEGSPELRVHAVLCCHRINTMPELAALEEASSSVLVAQRLNEEGERAWVVNDLIDLNTGSLRMRFGSDSERQLVIYAVHPNSTADGAVPSHASEETWCRSFAFATSV